MVSTSVYIFRKEIDKFCKSSNAFLDVHKDTGIRGQIEQLLILQQEIRYS
jgi:hypothetical protein